MPNPTQSDPAVPDLDVGLFGGSFDPPHVAHLIVAETMREHFELEEVWWIPAYRPPHKMDRSLAAAEHRLEMVRRATADNPAFVVKDLEVQRTGTSYTIDTLEELHAAHSSVRFALLIGGDSLAGFPSWHRPKAIVERAPLLVYRRPGWSRPVLPGWLEGQVHVADAPLLEVSGTQIRARRQDGRSIRYLVTAPVQAYIEEHRLYTEPPSHA